METNFIQNGYNNFDQICRTIQVEKCNQVFKPADLIASFNFVIILFLMYLIYLIHLVVRQINKVRKK